MSRAVLVQKRETNSPVSGGLELKQVQESNILGQWPGGRLTTSLNRIPSLLGSGWFSFLSIFTLYSWKVC